MSKLLWPIFALLTLSACDNNNNVRITSNNTDSGSVLKVIDALQCPNDQGVLTRRGSATDGGQTCTYVGPRGAEVKLHLVTLNGDTATSVLRRYQEELSPNAPKPPMQVSVDTDTTTGERSEVRMPGLLVEAQGEKATVKLPGLKIEADGDKANIRIGGITIRADDSGSEITANEGDNTAVITANDDGAVISATSSKAVRATMMNVSSNPGTDGWRVVGYEARGPNGGPIVIATFRSRDRDSDDIIEAAKALVTLNVGD